MTLTRGLRRPSIAGMLAVLPNRYLDVVGSTCIYDEHRGYTAAYESWPNQNGRGEPRWNELIADKFVHATMLLVKYPALYLNPLVRRRCDWRNASAGAPALAP